MNKSIFGLLLAGVLLVQGTVMAKPLPAKLVMPGGRTWKGSLVGRDGNWVEFSTDSSAKPIRVGADKIQELVFSVKLDTDKLLEMSRNLEYENIISALSRSLAPFSEYSDIPSNLTKYNTKLMELYYKTNEFDKSLAISTKIVNDDRDLLLREKSRIYQALALIGAGRVTEAESLLVQYGWNKEFSADTPPGTLYVVAKLMTSKKKYSEAIELVSKVVAFNSQDPVWMQPSELLCAELYTELDMYESADEVIREIFILYKGTSEYNSAQKLKVKIDQLRPKEKLEESLESE